MRPAVTLAVLGDLAGGKKNKVTCQFLGSSVLTPGSVGPRFGRETLGMAV